MHVMSVVVDEIVDVVNPNIFFIFANTATNIFMVVKILDPDTHAPAVSSIRCEFALRHTDLVQIYSQIAYGGSLVYMSVFWDWSRRPNESRQI